MWKGFFSIKFCVFVCFLCSKPIKVAWFDDDVGNGGGGGGNLILYIFKIMDSKWIRFRSKWDESFWVSKRNKRKNIPSYDDDHEWGFQYHHLIPEFVLQILCCHVQSVSEQQQKKNRMNYVRNTHQQQQSGRKLSR